MGFLLQIARTHLLVSTSATKELPERQKTEAGTNFASLVEAHFQVNTVKKRLLAFGLICLINLKQHTFKLTQLREVIWQFIL